MQKNSIEQMRATSYLGGGNEAYIEQLYELYIKDPSSVPTEWQNYFDGLPKHNGVGDTDYSHQDIRQYFLELARKPKVASSLPVDAIHEHKQRDVYKLVDAYRTRGHLAATFNPLHWDRPEVRCLEPNVYDLTPADLEQEFLSGKVMNGQPAKLKDIIARLQHLYCSDIGAEFMYIPNEAEVDWLKQRFEHGYTNLSYSADKKLDILRQLTAADGLEKYLGHKYVGQKRFSLEGGDSMVPLINYLIDYAGSLGVKEVSIGMAHRGRLNVLINVCGQPAADLFHEFEGTREQALTSGDVKYHLGFSSDIETSGGPVHISMAFNPSHLEVISSVVMGSVRARQDRRGDTERKRVLPIIVHGDAAIAGQGIVMETFNMSQTNAYGVGGTVHIVCNNQVGFTTSNSDDARSSLYCTDIAKMIQVPVFHVNSDNPEAVAFLSELAMDYRNKFGKDIIIDLVCYRRHGHNEADEPRGTQPVMYRKIDEMKTPRERYAARLIEQGVCDAALVDRYFDEYREGLDQGRVMRPTIKGAGHELADAWKPYLNQESNVPANTGVPVETLKALGAKLVDMPEGFELQRQISLVVKNRASMVSGEKMLDWGAAENLAYASLLHEGYDIRISGQDVRRGTFAHRHAAYHDQNSGEVFVPLQAMSEGKGNFQIYDSLLSEFGVLGFEYGYAKASPEDLVIWEAQFGDFANGAQVVVDQFLSSAWQKWQRLSGLVMLLPHGYEGQGPEHSSARLERYLQLCAQRNMQVCVPSTPAQVFHMLRRQVVRPYRKPLIVMTPKSLLRHKLAVSSLEELAQGEFQLLIPEIDPAIKVDKVRKVVLCSGKVYYDLLEQRQEKGQDDIAILRIEQLYPFPYEQLSAELEKYKKASTVVWCQEEPKNQGAWFITHHRLVDCLTKKQQLQYAGRPASASPAVGYSALHKKQQAELVNEALS